MNGCRCYERLKAKTGGVWKCIYLFICVMTEKKKKMYRRIYKSRTHRMERGKGIPKEREEDKDREG
jgi:hypothetical protein